MPIEERLAWFDAHSDREKHPVIVATVNKDDAVQIVGWACLSTYNERAGYLFTAASSIYIDKDYQRQGLGTLLMTDVIARGRKGGLQNILAGIDTEQTASVALHSRLGFVQVGRFEGIGYKFGRTLSVIWMQLSLTTQA